MNYSRVQHYPSITQSQSAEASPEGIGVVVQYIVCILIVGVGVCSVGPTAEGARSVPEIIFKSDESTVFISRSYTVSTSRTV